MTKSLICSCEKNDTCICIHVAVQKGVWGASHPEANGMKRSQIKWKLLLFDESDFLFLGGQFIFYSLLIIFIYSLAN